jgi:hypothetical protein
VRADEQGSGFSFDQIQNVFVPDEEIAKEVMASAQEIQAIERAVSKGEKVAKDRRGRGSGASA